VEGRQNGTAVKRDDQEHSDAANAVEGRDPASRLDV
jgi:hypothetical protein